MGNWSTNYTNSYWYTDSSANNIGYSAYPPMKATTVPEGNPYAKEDEGPLRWLNERIDDIVGDVRERMANAA